MSNMKSKTKIATKRQREGSEPASPKSPPHPLDAVLAHVRPPLPPLTAEAKDRITKAVKDNGRKLREAHTEGHRSQRRIDAGVRKLRACFLNELNILLELIQICRYDTLDESSEESRGGFNSHDSFNMDTLNRSLFDQRDSLDASVNNDAVKLILAHYRHIPELTATDLAQRLRVSFSSSLSQRKSVSLADSLLFSIARQQARPLLQPHDEPSGTTDVARALEHIVRCTRSHFADHNVDIPWSGDDALKALASWSP